MRMQVVERMAEKGDLSFIYDTWLQSSRYDGNIGRSCRNSVFFEGQKLVIDRLLMQSKTVIACADKNRELIYGYAVGETETEEQMLHYVYVKEAYRRFGIASKLCKNLFSDKKNLYYTHKTRNAEPFFNKMGWDYNPFPLFKKGIINEN